MARRDCRRGGVDLHEWESFLEGGVGDGIAGGLVFAIGDICTKVTTEGGGRRLFVIPLIAGYLLGTSLLQIGYQRGAALTVAGLATLLRTRCRSRPERWSSTPP